MKGNEAIAEAAIASGCLYYFGYPITPQTEISEYLAKRMPKVGGLCLQAESEIAAVNMLLGAASAGSRAMTSSSSPGISLKSEGISYIAGSDLPCLVVNVQRGGPGLGGIQPSQSDYYQATQMMEPVDFGAFEKRELPEKTWATNGHGFKRKRNIINSLYIDPKELEDSVIARYKRYDKVEETEVRCEKYMTDDADIIITAFGITSRIAKSTIAEARKSGIKAGLLRPITLWPFPKKELNELADTAKVFLSVEMSMGQMVDDVRLAVNGKRPVHFFGRTGGIIPSVDEVYAEIKKLSEVI